MKNLVHARWFAPAAVALALLLLGGAVWFTRLELRDELRLQLARRDGQLLESLLRHHLEISGGNAFSDPLLVLLDAERLPNLPGVLSLNLFSEAGAFVAAIPATAAEATLEVGMLMAAREQGFASRFLPERDLTKEFILPDPVRPGTTHRPLLEVVVPLPESEVGGEAGFARLLMDGRSLAEEYATLDASLTRKALISFALAGSAMALTLGLAFHRLDAANRRLQATNRELALAAKSAAIGTVTSHLLHGLKNPLAGLQQFVAAQAAPTEADWQDAAETTRRMRALIDRVLTVLRDDPQIALLEVSLPETLDHLVHRLRPLAESRSVVLVNHPGDALELSSRVANLTSLIVENLATNAIQASPPETRVEIKALRHDGALEIRVRDHAGGLPKHVLARLFTPVISTKEGGTGIGLALSRQIALSLSATLELAFTGPEGTEFVLRLPAGRPAAEDAAAAG